MISVGRAHRQSNRHVSFRTTLYYVSEHLPGLTEPRSLGMFRATEAPAVAGRPPRAREPYHDRFCTDFRRRPLGR